MVPEGWAAIIRPEQAAELQDRHDRIDERFEARRQHVGHQVESIGRAGPEPGLDVIGDLLGRSDDDAMPNAAAECAQELAHREIAAPRQVDRPLEHGVIGIGRERKRIRQRPVEFK